MIPRRIAVKGFLSYRDEQELDFRGGTLWLLAGANGSGKSAIFDAMTYALFGQHRGGAQGAAELLNKHANQFAIEFEFELEGKLYRIRRTLARGNRNNPTTQQIWSAVFPDPDVEPVWEPIEDSSKREGFNRWIANHVGLDYKTFTSSVLLLQGRAEQLLSARPQERFEVLAGIVNLEKYKRLGERAEEHRRQARAKVDLLHQRLETLPAIAPEALERERQALTTALAACEQARQESMQCEAWREQGLQWHALQQERAAVQKQLETARVLIRDEASILQGAARRQELLTVLPLIETWIQLRSQIEETTRQSREREAALAELEHTLQQQTLEVRQLQQVRDRLQEQSDQESRTLATLEQKHREGIVRHGRLEVHERQEAELARIEREMAAFPADRAEQRERLRTAVAELEDLERQLPVLRCFAAARERLREHQEPRQKLQASEAQVRREGEKAKAWIERLTPLSMAAEAAWQAAQDALTRAQVDRDRARAELDALSDLRGSARCRQCGQALTSEHLDHERTLRTEHLRDTEAALVQARAQAAQRDAEWKRLQAELAEAAKSREALREQYLALKNEQALRERESQHDRKDCAAQFESLPASWRARIGAAPPEDWTSTSWPDPATLEAYANQLVQATALRAQFARAEAQEQKLREWQVRRQTVLDAMASSRTGLPTDRAAFRRDWTRCEADLAVSRQNDARYKKDLRVAQANWERADQKRQELVNQLARQKGERDRENAILNDSAKQLQSLRERLPEPFRAQAEGIRLAEQSRWKSELRKLDDERVEERARELHEARARCAAGEDQLAQIDQRAEAIPEPARRAREVLELAARESRKREREQLEQANTIRLAVDRLEGQERARTQILEEFQRESAILERWKQLATLLGRDRLQLHLVRQAERQIIDLANGVLDRLTGGQLFLRLQAGLEGEASDVALDLEAVHRDAGHAAIGVAFLSGSQRFRVAVSLALGIGQFASREQRPIEAVIIDEGFGCLDRIGRQVMIQEMLSLRDQLRCIILVSHQEEFVEAFTEGYWFELGEEGTRVRGLRT